MNSKEIKKVAADLKIRINNQMQFINQNDNENAYLIIDGFLQQYQLTKADLFYVANELDWALIVKDNQLRVYYNLNACDYPKSIFDKEWTSFWTAKFTYIGMLTGVICGLIGYIPMIIGFVQNNLSLFTFGFSAILAAVIAGIISTIWNNLLMLKFRKVKYFK